MDFSPNAPEISDNAVFSAIITHPTKLQNEIWVIKINRFERLYFGIPIPFYILKI
jgi:hypothetical protein